MLGMHGPDVDLAAAADLVGANEITFQARMCSGKPGAAYEFAR